MIVISYVELVLMCFGIGMLWFLFGWFFLFMLDRWGMLKQED